MPNAITGKHIQRRKSGYIPGAAKRKRRKLPARRWNLKTWLAWRERKGEA